MIKLGISIDLGFCLSDFDKPGLVLKHVNKLDYWFVHLKVNCCYKTALIG